MDMYIHTGVNGFLGDDRASDGRGCCYQRWLKNHERSRVRSQKDAKALALRPYRATERNGADMISSRTHRVGISNRPSPDQTWWHIMHSLQFAGQCTSSNIFTRGECFYACLMYYAKVSGHHHSMLFQLQVARITSAHNNIRPLRLYCFSCSFTIDGPWYFLG